MTTSRRIRRRPRAPPARAAARPSRAAGRAARSPIGSREAGLRPIHQRRRDVAIDDPAEQPLAAAVAEPHRQRQPPHEVDQPVIEQRRARLEARRHAGAIDLHQDVVVQVAGEVLEDHPLGDATAATRPAASLLGPRQRDRRARQRGRRAIPLRQRGCRRPRRRRAHRAGATSLRSLSPGCRWRACGRQEALADGVGGVPRRAGRHARRSPPAPRRTSGGSGAMRRQARSAHTCRV